MAAAGETAGGRLPDAADDDPAWLQDNTWDRAEFLAPADDAIGERRLLPAIAPLFRRAALGDAHEMMQGIRHGREQAAAPDWQALTSIMRPLARDRRAGCRRWAVRDWASGGQRQSVAIARASYWARRVLILDEPTAALGVEESGEVLRILNSIKRERQIGMLVISHNMEHVWAVADDILVLRQGAQQALLRKDECTPQEVVGYITGAHQVTHERHQ